MKKILAVSSLIVLLFACQEDSPSTDPHASVTFTLKHSLRTPHNKIMVDLQAENGHVTAHVTSEPTRGYASQWEHTRIDTTFAVPNAVFDKLYAEAEAIDPDDIAASEVMGHDGTTCTLQFGKEEKVTHSVWTPDYDTKERHLTAFLQLCRHLIGIAGLTENDVF